MTSQGLLTPAWVNWFKQLYLRAGGSNTIDLATIEAELTSLQTSTNAALTSLQTQINGLDQGRQL